MSVVMPDEFDQDALQLTPVEDQETVEALSADGPDEPLGEGVGARRPDGVRRIRMPSEPNTSSKPVVNLSSRSRMRNLAGRARSARTELRLRELLDPPLPHRGGRDTAQVDPTGVDLDEEQHVEPPEQQRVDSEESQASMVAACALRNSAQVGPKRRGEGSMPCRRRTAQTLDGASPHAHGGQLAVDPPIPQVGFSLARRRTSLTLPAGSPGRPGR